MYLQSVEIENIRSIEKLHMSFKNGEEPGWHVLIGDNGSGKSTVVRSIAAALIGPDEIGSLRPYWEEWLTYGKDSGKIKLEITRDELFDKHGQSRPPKTAIGNEFLFTRKDRVTLKTNAGVGSKNPEKFNWSRYSGWFSASYGPFRRFTGGDSDFKRVFHVAPKAGAHLSVFDERAALDEALFWLKELDRLQLKEQELQKNAPAVYQSVLSDAERLLLGIKDFLNSGNLLPHGVKLHEISLEGDPIFRDAHGALVNVKQMSDGFRSILSLVFELIRQLASAYEIKKLFTTEQKDVINLPGVVLIDEVDAHLHPVWQTRIGQWFTKSFPKIQFIVTTHSPLVCRACVNGSIWRLPAPDSSGELTRLEGPSFDSLVYGDVLEAIETGAFGANLSRGIEGIELQNRYRTLMYKERYGVKITDEECEEFNHLKKIFQVYAED